ncbi:Dynein light chain 1, axonemal, partial [Phlyctochytrium bullatum]
VDLLSRFHVVYLPKFDGKGMVKTTGNLGPMSKRILLRLRPAKFLDRLQRRMSLVGGGIFQPDESMTTQFRPLTGECRSPGRKKVIKDVVVLNGEMHRVRTLRDVDSCESLFQVQMGRFEKELKAKLSKGTSIKDAIKAWEDKTGQSAAEAPVVKLLSQQPFIVKMDASLAQLAKCEHLGLSTNQIEKISNLNGLSCLKILSLGRNSIKKIEGLDAVSETLEELWISYNQIERLNGIECCKKLKVLYASNNKIKLWEGVTPLQSLPLLEDILLVGNPIEEKCTADGVWVSEISKKFPALKKLDGKPIIREEDFEEEKPAE